MGRRAGLLLAALLLGACIAGARADAAEVEDMEDVEEEKAFLVTRKRIAEESLVVAADLTVEIELHNAGSSSALDVEVADVPWPAEQFELVDGNTKASFPRIPAGVTVKFAYHIRATSAGFYTAHPASVSYRDTPDATQPLAAQSSVPHLYILTPTQKYVKQAITVGSYVTLGSLRTVTEWRNAAIVIGLAAAGVIGYRVYQSLTAARKRSQYQRALEEVNKYE